MQVAEAEVVAEFVPMADFDAADVQEEIQFLLCVIVHQFVFGDSVFVEAAGLFPRLEYHHVMTVHRTAVGTGQTGGPGTDHGNALAGGGATRERVLGEVRVVHGVTLQQAD
ncbi:hypothetical protein D3C76_747530 [compost metagenome]